MPTENELLTANEAAAVSGVTLKEAYKVARERLPNRMIVRKRGTMFFKPSAAVCLRIDHVLPKDVPVKVRKHFYASFEKNPAASRIEHREGLLVYVVDAASAREAVTEKLEARRTALDLVVEDPEVQAGAATFAGTRILVHTIAGLLKAGASAEELKEDYPRLTDAMLAAAPLYARTHPRRGRPRVPAWRDAEPTSVRRQKRTTP